jgi:hypothetical protein
MIRTNHPPTVNAGTSLKLPESPRGQQGTHDPNIRIFEHSNVCWQSLGESYHATGIGGASENVLKGLPGMCLGVRGRAGKLVWPAVCSVW